MVPAPIALLTLFYGIIATVSAASVWGIMNGSVDRPMAWPLAWLALSAGAMFGLPLLKPWARGLALAGSGLMALGTLAVAGVLVISGRPLGALAVTLAASV
ncbi:MAG: hypothetical protein HYW10_03185, partial [Candidatus Omnitrophica bacterium]|nr:hypothetical protein [Candidatus Omnitrophota bacterium]